jgi:ADP-ribose pyrophosphatase YjhB (NUDIX family)
MDAPGVGCGAAILRDGRLLLVKRLRAPEAGHWSLPGGKVDFGESIADAVRREIREEVGLEIELGASLGLVEMIGIDDQHWVSPIFLAHAAEGEARNNEPEKIEAIAWVALDAPPSPLAMAARKALQALRTI